MRVLFEFPSLPRGYIIAFAGGIMFLAVRAIIKKNEEWSKSKFMNIAGWFFTGIGMIVVLGQIVSFAAVAVKYHNGGYLEVKGIVEHFQTQGSNESFSVDGVFFHYNSHTILPYYTNVQGAGGVITGNGQSVLIRYYPVERGEESQIVMIAACDNRDGSS